MVGQANSADRFPQTTFNQQDIPVVLETEDEEAQKEVVTMLFSHCAYHRVFLKGERLRMGNRCFRGVVFFLLSGVSSSTGIPYSAKGSQKTVITCKCFTYLLGTCLQGVAKQAQKRDDANRGALRRHALDQSEVLKKGWEHQPAKRFALIRHTGYTLPSEHRKPHFAIWTLLGYINESPDRKSRN